MVAGLALAAILAGCAATLPEIDTGLAGSIGQPIDGLVNRLGIPERTYPVGDATVYEWGVRNTATAPTAAGGGAYEMLCSVKVMVGANHLVQRYDWSGEVSACYEISERLRRTKPVLVHP